MTTHAEQAALDAEAHTARQIRKTLRRLNTAATLLLLAAVVTVVEFVIRHTP